MTFDVDGGDLVEVVVVDGARVAGADGLEALEEALVVARRPVDVSVGLLLGLLFLELPGNWVGSPPLRPYRNRASMPGVRKYM